MKQDAAMAPAPPTSCVGPQTLQGTPRLPPEMSGRLCLQLGCDSHHHYVDVTYNAIPSEPLPAGPFVS